MAVQAGGILRRVNNRVTLRTAAAPVGNPDRVIENLIGAGGEVTELPPSGSLTGTVVVFVIKDGVPSLADIADLVELVEGADLSGYAQLAGATFTGAVSIDDDDGVATFTVNSKTAASVGVSNGDEAHIDFEQAGTRFWRINSGSFLGVAQVLAIEDAVNSNRALVGFTSGAAGSAFTQLLDKLVVKRGTSGQSANLQEWKDHNDTLLAAVTPSGAVRLVEQSEPAAPAANSVVLYAQDNGAGKTQLMAKFSSGAAQQVAIQP